MPRIYVAGIVISRTNSMTVPVVAKAGRALKRLERARRTVHRVPIALILVKTGMGNALQYIRQALQEFIGLLADDGVALLDGRAQPGRARRGRRGAASHQARTNDKEQSRRGAEGCIPSLSIVHLSPSSGGTADMAAGPGRARTGPIRCNRSRRFS